MPESVATKISGHAREQSLRPVQHHGRARPARRDDEGPSVSHATRIAAAFRMATAPLPCSGRRILSDVAIRRPPRGPPRRVPQRSRAPVTTRNDHCDHSKNQSCHRRFRSQPCSMYVSIEGCGNNDSATRYSRVNFLGKRAEQGIAESLTTHAAR